VSRPTRASEGSASRDRTAEASATKPPSAGYSKADEKGVAAAARPAASLPTPAWRSRRAWLTLTIVVLTALAIDLGTKYWAFETLGERPVEIDPVVVQTKIDAGVPLNHLQRIDQLMLRGDPPAVYEPILPPHEPSVVIPYVLEFKLVLNAGAVFGSGHGKRWLFVGFTFVAFGFCLYLFAAWTRKDEWLTHTALGLIVAGGLGNLYDRIVYACVRDFLHPLPNVTYPFGWSPFGSREVWPYVSNVADAFLLLGVGVIVIRMWKAPQIPHDGESVNPDSADEPSSNGDHLTAIDENDETATRDKAPAPESEGHQKKAPHGSEERSRPC